MRAVCEPDAFADVDTVWHADGVAFAGSIVVADWVFVSHANDFSVAFDLHFCRDAINVSGALEFSYPYAFIFTDIGCIAVSSNDCVEICDVIDVVFFRSNMLQFANVFEFTNNFDVIRISYSVAVAVSDAITEQGGHAKRNSIVIGLTSNRHSLMAGIHFWFQLQFVRERVARVVNSRERKRALERVGVHSAFGDGGILRVGHVCDE